MNRTSYFAALPRESRSVCPTCDGCGMVIYRDEQGRNYARPCSCRDRTEERRAVLKLNAAIPDLPRGFEPIPESVRYVERFRTESKDANWIVFMGPSGAGKTSQAAWIADNILTKYGANVRFYNAFELTRKLASRQTPEEERKRILQDAIGASFVVLDDLLKVAPAKGAFRYAEFFEALASVIWGRYAAKRPTAITTERSPSELGAIDAAMARRIVERAAQYSVIFEGGPARWAA